MFTNKILIYMFSFVLFLMVTPKTKAQVNIQKFGGAQQGNAYVFLDVKKIMNSRAIPQKIKNLLLLKVENYFNTKRGKKFLSCMRINSSQVVNHTKKVLLIFASFNKFFDSKTRNKSMIMIVENNFNSKILKKCIKYMAPSSRYIKKINTLYYKDKISKLMILPSGNIIITTGIYNNILVPNKYNSRSISKLGESKEWLSKKDLRSHFVFWGKDLLVSKNFFKSLPLLSKYRATFKRYDFNIKGKLNSNVNINMTIDVKDKNLANDLYKIFKMALNTQKGKNVILSNLMKGTKFYPKNTQLIIIINLKEKDMFYILNQIPII